MFKYLVGVGCYSGNKVVAFFLLRGFSFVFMVPGRGVVLCLCSYESPSTVVIGPISRESCRRTFLGVRWVPVVFVVSGNGMR